MKKQNEAISHLSEISEISAISEAVTHPVPLILSGLGTIWASYHTGENLNLTLAYGVFAYLLSLLAVIDFKHGILPHILTATLAVMGVALAPTLGLGYGASLIGAAVAFGGLFACAFITEALTGKEALGGGDLWLVLGLGTWLGAGGLPMLLVAAALCGFISICIKNWMTQNLLTYATDPKKQQFPFGPALCAAGWLALFYADAYWNLIGMITTPAA